MIIAPCCPEPEFRYRCVICWLSVCWCAGCADDVGVTVSGASFAFRDGDADGGVCDPCWLGLGGGELHVEVCS